MDPRYLLNPKLLKKSTARNDPKKTASHGSLGDLHSSPVPSTSPSLPTRPSEQATSTTSPTSPRAIRSYDPRALLNPRGKSTPTSPTSRPSPSSHTSANMSTHDVASAESKAILNGSDDSASTLQSGDFADQNPADVNEHKVNGVAAAEEPPKRLLEGLYGVESREEQPRKKIRAEKKDDANEGKSGGSFEHKGSGVIGDYMKVKSGAEDMSPIPDAVVDLTNDDDDDEDLQIVGARSKNDDIVCFGRIHLILKAYLVPRPKDKSFTIGDQWPTMMCTLKRKLENKHNAVLDVLDPFGTEFATVDIVQAVALTQAMDVLSHLDTALVVPIRKKRNAEWAGQSCSYPINASVNVYGRRGDAERIGKLFGHYNLWFQPPMLMKRRVEVVNPHAHKKTPLQTKVAGGRPPGQTLSDSRTSEEIVEHMATMIDEWARKQSKELPETEAPVWIKTPLLTHQKQALTFMLSREKPRTYNTDDDSHTLSLWRKKPSARGVVYEDIVSGLTVTQEPPQVFGGLLADVMGLGKTLDALTLVASTAGEADEFGKARPDRRSEEDGNIKSNTKATLVVCPTSTVQNWESQIREHLDTETLSSYIYHGQNRTDNAFDLKKYDVVVTTYGTVASDCRGGSSVLEQVKWFRVILDEAHTIREAKAQQSQACYRLLAQRRWCLTGTPIQNRLSDLGSLTRFLRLYPYNDTAFFNQYMSTKTNTTDEIFSDRLRLFVDSFVLRRLRDRIDLPDRKEITATLKFSKEEQQVHDFFKDKAMIRIEKLMGTQEKRTGVHLHMLKGITTLRLICAHGRDLLKERELKDLQGLTADEAIDLEEEEDLRTITKREAYENFQLMADADQDFCVQCENKLTGDTPQASGSEDPAVRCYVLPCSDTVCAECFNRQKPLFDDVQGDQAIECPFCSKEIAAQYVSIDASSAAVQEMIPEDTTSDPEPGKLTKYTGPKTKVKALLTDLAEIREESQALEAKGEPPIKTVIFSEFTSNLSLIEKALAHEGYNFARIDGTMSLANRRKVLDALDSDNSLTILLASIKAAGQGLNLTVASRAFIMEPMWNPAAEQQAVDRIYRIGQKRNVVIKRYQIEASIEVKIMELAKKKLQLAGMAMEKGEHRKLSKTEKREQNLKDIQSLFK